jgi:hypothetical protein
MNHSLQGIKRREKEKKNHTPTTEKSEKKGGHSETETVD